MVTTLTSISTFREQLNQKRRNLLYRLTIALQLLQLTISTFKIDERRKVTLHSERALYILRNSIDRSATKAIMA